MKVGTGCAGSEEGRLYAKKVIEDVAVMEVSDVHTAWWIGFVAGQLLVASPKVCAPP